MKVCSFDNLYVDFFESDLALDMHDEDLIYFYEEIASKYVMLCEIRLMGQQGGFNE